MKHIAGIGWNLDYRKGIDLLVCSHHTDLKEDVISSGEPQYKINSALRDVIKYEIHKILDSCIIYPISDSKWVPPVYVPPKKMGTIVVKDDNDQEIARRVPTKWRDYINYR